MCDACKNGNKLRTEPLSELELHRIARYRETGKIPPLPAWYRAHVRAAFKQDGLEIFPSDPIERVMATMTTHLTDLRRKRDFPWNGERMSTAEYVEHMERTWNLKPTKLRGRKHELGRYRECGICRTNPREKHVGINPTFEIDRP